MERSKTNIVEKKEREGKCKVKSCKNRFGTCVYASIRSLKINVSSDVCTGSSSRGKSKNCMHYMQKSTLRAESPSIFLDKSEETLLAG